MPEANKITDIQVQQKRRDRYSIFINDEFAFGIHQDVLIQSGIAKGDNLSPEQIQDILDLEDFKSGKDKAIRLLASRARSEKELRDRLSQKGYHDHTIDRVLKELQRLNLVDDTEFAKMFARHRMITKPVGEYFLRFELKQKGLNEQDIQAGVDEAYTEQSEAEFAEQAAVKSKKKYSRLDRDKARQRVSDFLSRRGFRFDIIQDIMERWDHI